MSKKRRQFDRAFKLEAVRLVQEEGRTAASVARDLGVAENLLYRWKQQLADTERVILGYSLADILPIMENVSSRINAIWISCHVSELINGSIFAYQFPTYYDSSIGNLSSLSCDNPRVSSLCNERIICLVTGSQPTSTRFMKACSNMELHQAYTCYNNPKGNADTERMMRTLKEELIWLREWSNPGEVADVLATWIEQYNESYLHSAYGYKSPNEVERSWNLKKDTLIS
jgi:Transposase/Integrase core domain